MAVMGGYDDEHGFVKCPLCDEYSEYVVVEVEDGVWLCLACVTEFCHDGFVGAGRHRCKSSHSVKRMVKKTGAMRRNLTL